MRRKEGGCAALFILLALLSAAAGLPLPAQSAADGSTEIRAAVPFPQSEGAVDDPSALAELLHDIIRIELGKYGIAALSEPDPAGEIDFIFRTSFLRTDDSGRLLIAMAVTDPAETGVHFGITRQGRADLTLVNTIDRMIAAIVPAVLESLPLVDAESLLVPPPPLTLLFRFSSPDDGAEIRISGTDLTGTVRGGTTEPLFLPVLTGTSLPVEVSKPGYRTARYDFEAPPEEAGFSVKPLLPEMNLVRSWSWSTSRYLGAGMGIRWFLLPDWLFFGAEQYLYSSWYLTKGARPVFHADTRFTGGGYIIAPPESRFRVGLSAALQLHLSWFTGFEPEDRSIALYPDFSLTFLALWIEYAFPRFTPYLQTELFYVFEKKNNILRPGGRQAVTLGVMLPWS